MNKQLITTIVIALGVIIAGGVIFIIMTPSANNVPNTTEPQTSPGKVRIIRMINNEFVPKEMTIAIGDTVTFVNEDDEAHWPASDIHPTHLLCPGFDSLIGLKKGDTYAYTFVKAQTCSTHDHLMPSMRGKVIIR